MHFQISAIVALLLLVSLGKAQTSTVCDPTKKSCPADPALGKTITTDFTGGITKDWAYVSGSEGLVSYNSNGANFVITEKNQAPTLISEKYIMFGKVSATIKASPGTGIVSAFILLSDDLDEIDWEWIGGDDGNVQTNIFRQGNDGLDNLSKHTTNPSNQEEWHTYTLDWTSTALTWYIDNVAIRTVRYSDFDGATNRYPQTPMQVHMGNWIGCPDAAAAANPATSGRCAWAGGPADWSKAPYNMQIKSVTIEDYGCASEYVYGDKSGDWQSIQSVGTCEQNTASTTTASTTTASTTTASSHSSTTTTHHSSTTTPYSSITTPHSSTTTTHSTTSTTAEEHISTHSPIESSTKPSDTSKSSDVTPSTKASETSKLSGKPPATTTTSIEPSYTTTSLTHSSTPVSSEITAPSTIYPASTPSKSSPATSPTQTPESDTWTVGGSGHDATSGSESYVVSTVTSTFISVQSQTVTTDINTVGATETTETTATIPETTTTITTTTTVTSTVQLLLSTPSATTSLSSTVSPLLINPTSTGFLPTGTETGTPTTFSYSTTSTTSTAPVSSSASVSPIVKANGAPQLLGSTAMSFDVLALFLCVAYFMA